MVKDEKPFIKFNIQNFVGSHINYDDESLTTEFLIKKIELINLLEKIEGS